jgi:hypothetical protein
MNPGSSTSVDLLPPSGSINSIMPSWATAMREPSDDHVSEQWAAPLMISRDAPVATSTICTWPFVA